MNSKFIHCDCDCFFAAIEIRDDPSLVGLPVAVGGSEQRRGVIATCNYQARKFGIHSAMASATAKRLCRDLIIIPGNMEKYRIASQQMQSIFKDYTDLIEPLSLDEAYLDVSSSDACQGSATLMAEEIRQRVKKEINITLSAGIAPNKFLSKIASDWNKPDGQFVITPDQVESFIVKLPVKKLHGVGKVTARKMQLQGIDTCRDLQKYTLTQLIDMFGTFGERLYSLARGIDNRKIQMNSKRKSISVEHTFAQDLPTIDLCLQTLPEILTELEKRINNTSQNITIAKQLVKLKFNNFVSTTVEQNSHELNLETFRLLCQTGFARGNKPVRLLGLGIRLKASPSYQQLELEFEKKLNASFGNL